MREAGTGRRSGYEDGIGVGGRRHAGHVYCRDPRYGDFRSLLKSGNIYEEEFCYHELPDKLDPFDWETYKNSPVEFYVVCTDVETGRAVYHRCTGEKEGRIW